jgi:hypothetical protein
MYSDWVSAPIVKSAELVNSVDFAEPPPPPPPPPAFTVMPFA